MTDNLPQTRSTLKRRLAEDLGVSTLLEDLWEDLIDEGFVGDYLLKRNRKQYNIVLHRAQFPPRRPGRPRGQKSGAKIQPQLTQREKLRAEIFSKDLGRCATREPDVQQIRTALFGGSVLTHEKAEHLLLQIAPRYVPLDWFTKNRVPILDHTSYFSNQRSVARPIEEGAEILLEWAGGTRRHTITKQLLSELEGKGAFIHLPQTPEDVFASPQSARESRRRYVRVPVRSRGDLPESLRESFAFRWCEVRVSAASVLGELSRVASDLAESYHWTKMESLLFLIEGKVPLVVPISVNFASSDSPHHRRLTVTLEFEPWVTINSVSNAYRRARRASLGKQARMMNPRRLHLFDFVETYREKIVGKSWEQIEDGALAFPWEEVARLWTAEHPKWRYRSVRDMRAMFRRTRKELLRPPLTPLWGAISTPGLTVGNVAPTRSVSQ